MPNTLRQSSWIVTLSLAAIAALYLTLVWLPGRRAIQEMREQMESKRSFVAQAAGLSSALVGVQQELDKAKSAVSQWEKKSPKKKELSEFYGKIDALAKDAHLAVT